MARKGILFVLSGPSGAGKGTVLHSLFQDLEGIEYSVSATTRKPRNKEVEGKNYFFVSDERFSEMQNSGELLEYVEKFGNRYGTVKSYVKSILDTGKDVLLEIETIGAEKLRKDESIRKEMDIISIFITPSDVYELAKRIKTRGSESNNSLEERVRIGFSEIKSIHDYDYIVVNDDLSLAIREVKSIILAERCSVKRNAELIDKIWSSVSQKASSSNNK